MNELLTIFPIECQISDAYRKSFKDIATIFFTRACYLRLTFKSPHKPHMLADFFQTQIGVRTLLA